MPTHLPTGLVRLAVRRAWTVIPASLLLFIVSGGYAARHVAIDTDMGGPPCCGAAGSERDSVTASSSHHPTG